MRDTKVYQVTMITYVYGASSAREAEKIVVEMIPDNDGTMSFVQFAREDKEVEDALEDAVYMSAGPRCPTHEAGCPTCDLWAEFDRRVAPRG